MGLIHFPSTLTEEEEMLKQAFARLKKKKKMFQMLKSSAHHQEKEASHSKSLNKPAPAPSTDSADKATEQAKKLVQSGAIKVTGVKEKSGFKRSKTLERKKDTEKPATSVGFQPFMPYAGDEEDDKMPPSKRIKGLGESFVSSGYSRNYDRPDREHQEAPKKGNTIFVQGIGITKESVQKSFSNVGKIINVSMERNTAFVTYHKMEAADKAIADLNGSMTNNIQLRVQMARHQPSIEAVGDATSTSSWSSIAASNSQKGLSRKEKRGVVTYDDDFF